MKKGYIFGNFVAIYNKVSKNKIKKARKKIVKDLCNAIRRIAREYPEEFFIEKDTSIFPVDKSTYTVGAKLIVPYMPSEPKKETL